MTYPDPIRIEGLAAFSRSLRKLDAEAPKQLRLVFNEAANLVVADARSQIPRQSGRAAASLKARSTRTEARVVGGGKRVPYYPWLDFGGRVGRRRSIERAFLREGRYIYPSYNRLSDSGKLERVMADGLLKVVSAAGLATD